MENNTTFFNSCNMPDWYWIVCEVLFQATYYYCVVFCLIFASISQIVSLRVYYCELKKDGAYSYQIMLTVLNIFELIFGTALYSFVGFYGMIGAERNNYFSFILRSNYIVMWFYAHLCSQLFNSLITASLLLNIFITWDRIYALLKPTNYYKSKHTLRERFTFAVALLMGFSTSVFDCFRKTVQKSNTSTMYTLVYNEEYTSSKLINFLNQLRNALRMLAFLTLIISNCLMLYLYQTRYKIGRAHV